MTIGSRWMIRHTPVPILIRSVTAAIAASAANGSSVWLYSGGSSPPPGYGVSRLTGIWVCSGSISDSNPRSSTLRPSSAGCMP